MPATSSVSVVRWSDAKSRCSRFPSTPATSPPHPPSPSTRSRARSRRVRLSFEPTYMSAVLRHVLLLQRDVPAAAKFYREGLGLVVNVCTERWAELGDARPTSDASTSPPTVIALKAVDSEAQRSTGYSPCSTSRSATSTPPSTTSFARVLCWTARSDTHPGVRWRPCALRTDTCSASSNPPKASETRWRRSATTPRQRGCLRTRPQAHGGNASRRRACRLVVARRVATIVVIATTSHPTRHSVRLPVAVAWCYTATRTRFSARWNGRATRPLRASPRSPFSNTATSSPSTPAPRGGRDSRRRALRRARKNTRRRRRPRARARRGRTQVSYRPYLAASAALMRLLASEDVARAVARATRDAMRVDAEVTGSNPGRVAIDDDRVAIDDDRDPSGRRFKVPRARRGEGVHRRGVRATSRGRFALARRAPRRRRD